MSAHQQARKVAVAACALASDGHVDDMDVLVGLYLQEARERGMSDCMALRVLTHSLVGLAVHVAGDDGKSRFDFLAHRMAVTP